MGGRIVGIGIGKGSCVVGVDGVGVSFVDGRQGGVAQFVLGRGEKEGLSVFRFF